MSDDLVKRLRAEGIAELDEAADRIEKLEAALRKIKDLHHGPEDEEVVIIRDDMTYFIVCEALGETP